MAGKLSGPFRLFLAGSNFLRASWASSKNRQLYSVYLYTRIIFIAYIHRVVACVYNISIYKCRYISCRDFFSRCLEFWREWFLTSFVKSDLGQFQQLKVSNLDLSIVTSGTRAAL